MKSIENFVLYVLVCIVSRLLIILPATTDSIKVIVITINCFPFKIELAQDNKTANIIGSIKCNTKKLSEAVVKEDRIKINIYVFILFELVNIFKIKYKTTKPIVNSPK